MKTKLDDYNIPISGWEHLIDEWIFSERDRKITKRRFLDDIGLEQLAEEFSLSTQQIKTIVKRCRNQLFKHI